MAFGLLIWDCDGCLVDSEHIACRLEAEYLTAAGYPISPQDVIDRFAGVTSEKAVQIICEEKGKGFALDFPFDSFRQNVLVALEKELQPIEHLADMLGQLEIPMCVASGSRQERVQMVLRHMGILPYFEGKIFSSTQVARGKPAPDVFLYAADQMGIDPSRCLVIEDSVPGVAAAKAACMPVFAYLGASHVTPRWREKIAQAAPDALFDDMRELPELINNYRLPSSNPNT